MARLVRRGIQVVLAAFVAAMAGLALPAAPAVAAGCPSADGVTVVVDFHELGGGVQTACVAGGGGDTAAQLFPAAGFDLTYVQRQPGFVCRVEGLPSDNPCLSTPPSDAYWALFWSDGKSGSWSYASTGAGGQRVPNGGYVAFSWNGSSARTAPGYAPTPHSSATPTPNPSPTHTSAPSSHPSQHHSAGSTPSMSASASPSETTSAAPTKKPRGQKSRSPEPKPEPERSPSAVTETATADATGDATGDAVPTAAEPADPDDGGLPTWVAPVVIVVLFGAGGAAAVVRRLRGMPGA